MNLRPLGDGLVVEPIVQEELIGHGILLPVRASDKPMQGKVLAIGPGARNEDGERIAVDVTKGDVVLYAAYAGTEVEIEDEKYLILKETDVLAIGQESRALILGKPAEELQRQRGIELILVLAADGGKVQ